MTNPFEDESGRFHVLMNDEGQYSIWPTFARTPDGWKILQTADRRECLDYINERWTDMRPASLIKKMQ